MIFLQTNTKEDFSAEIKDNSGEIIAFLNESLDFLEVSSFEEYRPIVEQFLGGTLILNEETAGQTLAKVYHWMQEYRSLKDKADQDKKAANIWAFAYVGFALLAGIFIGLNLIPGMVISLIGMLVTLIGMIKKANDYEKSKEKIDKQAQILIPKINGLRSQSKGNKDVQEALDRLEKAIAGLN